MEKYMRIGFTTGSCAAAASKAAVYMLLSDKIKEDITIKTPKGMLYHASIIDIKRENEHVSCAVIKDGGDDPDITTGTKIVVDVFLKDEISAAQFEVGRVDGRAEECDRVMIHIDGGEGVGRVTRPGLDQPVGAAAINHVPREMIEKEVREVCELFDFKGYLLVVISVPDGEEIAKKTFNPRLGIVGGISILGTTGIVEPMSSQALLDAIWIELRQRKEEGTNIIAISPGNYGLDYMKRTYDYDLDRSVKCSNFIGKTIDMAVELGFHKLLLTGHIGKLIKVAGGIMNTHSKEGDCRMELFAAAALRKGADGETVRNILDCVTTEAAIERLLDTYSEQVLTEIMEYLLEQMLYYLNKRAGWKLEIACIVYSNDYGELAKSDNADVFLQEVCI